jgi:two-component system nitrogen regulation response regulator NtrX
MEPVIYLGCPPAERPETERSLAAARVSVIWADSVTSALSELERRDLPVLLDLSRGGAALQSARDLRTHRASTLMFAVVDSRRPDLTTEAVLVGMADVFARPLGGRRVAHAIARERRYERRAESPSAASVDDLYCHSATMREVATVIARAASMRAGVLLRGERGTGRQLIARSIHAAQGTGASPFIVVDCADYEPDELSERLFGTSGGPDLAKGLERIAERGLVYQSIGGTLYLQNIADAPARVQARLARLLRDREATLASSGEAVNLDVRPMASADPGIETSVQEGRIRDDLFRRLSVLRIDVPPLRSRREDIPALANFFVREVCAAHRVPPKTLSRAALLLISALPWRGNAIELRTLVEAVVNSLAVGRGIGLEDVLAHVKLDGGSVVFANGGTLRQARARFEREYISAVLEQHQGRISEAAKALGIQRTNLYRKIRSLKVARERRSKR